MNTQWICAHETKLLDEAVWLCAAVSSERNPFSFPQASLLALVRPRSASHRRPMPSTNRSEPRQPGSHHAAAPTDLACAGAPGRARGGFALEDAVELDVVDERSIDGAFQSPPTLPACRSAHRAPLAWCPIRRLRPHWYRLTRGRSAAHVQEAEPDGDQQRDVAPPPPRLYHAIPREGPTTTYPTPVRFGGELSMPKCVPSSPLNKDFSYLKQPQGTEHTLENE